MIYIPHHKIEKKLCYFITLPMIAIFVGSATYICYKVAIFGNELFSYKAKVSASQSKTLWLYNERASISQ